MGFSQQLLVWASNLVVVDIPEGVKRINAGAFYECGSLTTLSFPRTLKSIGDFAFQGCSSLENVDPLHTNLKELGEMAFHSCYELKLMTIPDSLQMLSYMVFNKCYMLTPSNTNTDQNNTVVAYLHSQQLLLSANPPES